MPSGAGQTLQQSLGIALTAGKRIPGLADAATGAFIDGMHAGVLVAAGVALVGAVVALVWLPARASYDATVPIPTRSAGPSRSPSPSRSRTSARWTVRSA